MKQEKLQIYVIAVLVEHKPGVLYEVANLFRRRGFNIESITVGKTKQKDQARMTITVNGDEYTVEQIIKQLNKLINVIKVAILEAGNMVLRELVLIKIHTADSKARSELLQYTTIFRGRVIDVSPDSMIIEVTGDTEKVDAFIELSRSFGIKEISRTGATALNRGGKVIRE